MVCAQLQELTAAMDALQGQAEMSEEDIDPAVEQAIADAATKVAEANDAMIQVCAQLSGEPGTMPPGGPSAPAAGPKNVPPPA